jgi:hypothetical protein
MKGLNAQSQRVLQKNIPYTESDLRAWETPAGGEPKKYEPKGDVGQGDAYEKTVENWSFSISQLVFKP